MDGAIGEGIGATTAAAPGRYINRELSWLDFNTRVFRLAEDPEIPLLERVRFLAISASNLDEFFQTRVGSLMERVGARVATSSIDGLAPADHIAALRARARTLMTQQAALFADQIAPQLAAAGLPIVSWGSLGGADRAYLSDIFMSELFPVVTPLAVDPAHPFPYISNLSLNLVVVAREPASSERRIARVKIPPVLPRLVQLPGETRFVPLDEVIAAHLPTLFPGMEIVEHSSFRLTRHTDFELDTDDDLVEAVRSILARRRRSELVVRLEIDASMSDDVAGKLVRELRMDPADVYRSTGMLDIACLFQIADVDIPALRFPRFVPVTPAVLNDEDSDHSPSIFDVVNDNPIFVHHPYDSFDTTVEAFIQEAADDPDVLAIKQTLYRTSEPDSPIVHALARAAERGKQVVALIELTARFDEEANIGWARLLEKAGAHVVYGMVGFKTHCKIVLVVRREPSGTRRYVHIGTGNYNPVTAQVYEDIGIITADQTLGAEVNQVFNTLTGYSREHDFSRLLVAPMNLRRSLQALIADEARPGGRIVVKINSLTDPGMIDALYAASQGGSEVDIIVRGACCLRPGVPGLSENIRVRSIVGRFLEHSRIFRFGADPASARYYVGSADLMTRNIDRRVEVVVPVDEQRFAARLEEILGALLADDMRAWELGADGSWRHAAPGAGVDAQALLQEAARRRAATGSTTP